MKNLQTKLFPRTLPTEEHMKINWKAFLHFIVGLAAAGLAVPAAGGPITAKTVLFPAIASALTSVIAVFHGNAGSTP